MEILYKYVSASRALACIPEVGDGTLRATQPAALNDPFECAIIPTYVIQDQEDEDRRLAQALSQINESVPITEHDVRKARQQYGSLFTRQLFAKQVSTKLGIVSFTTDPFNPLMWSHYTVDSSGFAIGYDKAQLESLVSGDGALKPVLYGGKPSLILGPIVLTSPRSNLAEILSYKSDQWSYEHEWRLIVEMNNTIGMGESDRHGQPINLVRVPNEAVVRIYYTERTPLETVETIHHRLANSNNRYNVDIMRKLTMSFDSYGYEEFQE